MVAYQKYLAGELVDYELPQEEIDRAVAELPAVAV
jgi:tryptophan synthase beta chain